MTRKTIRPLPSKPIVSNESTIAISEREYNTLRATAELLNHLDVFQFTLRTMGETGETGRMSLEDAFRD
jgi:hypothetical protein